MVIIVEEYAKEPHHKIELKDGIIHKKSTNVEHSSLFSFRAFFCSVFLPQGFPHSVTGDYLQYQLWDTVQAFASSITGALATEAVLKGAGVGNQTATPLATALTWLVKDGMGMIGRIGFSYSKGTVVDSSTDYQGIAFSLEKLSKVPLLQNAFRILGSQLDYDCKKWRLVADILNDFAFFVDLLSPLWPHYFLFSACISSLFRCVVGVAGGATRTTIVQHQARRNNLADVASKDGSQETLVNAIALVVSLILLPAVSGKHTVVWSLFVLFTFIHIFANWRAVRSLQLDVLNGKRAALVVRSFLSTGEVPSVKKANMEEPLFYNLYSTRHMGCSYEKLVKANRHSNMICKEGVNYTILFDPRYKTGWIAMKKDTSFKDQLRAFFHLESISISQKEGNFETFFKALENCGWNTTVHHLNFDEWTYSVAE